MKTITNNSPQQGEAEALAFICLPAAQYGNNDHQPILNEMNNDITLPIDNVPFLRRSTRSTRGALPMGFCKHPNVCERIELCCCLLRSVHVELSTACC